MKFSGRILSNRLFFILFLLPGISSSQALTNSPYSRFGIGDLQSRSLASNRGMGGSGAAYYNPYSLNFNNIASLTSLSLTTFETGFTGYSSRFETSGRMQRTGSGTLSYFSLGFPVATRKWGTAFGLVPYSNVGYNIFQPETGTGGVSQVRSYEGSGGINQFFLANAWSPFHGVSLGLNSSYLFGSTTEERRVEFSDPSYWSTRVTDEINYGDFYFSGSLLLSRDSLRFSPSDSLVYLNKRIRNVHDSLAVFSKFVSSPRFAADSMAGDPDGVRALVQSLEAEATALEELKNNLKETRQRGDWSFSFGLNFAWQTGIQATQTRSAESYRKVGNSTNISDTTNDILSREGKVTFPLSLGGGFMLKKGTRWTFLADYSMQHWSDFSMFGQNDSLRDSWNASAGIQYVPNDRMRKSIWDPIQYRVGFRYGQTYLQLGGHQLKEYAVTAGLGIPIRRVATVIQLFGEIGRRGTSSDNLILEKFVRFGLGITLNDRWFIKPKYE